MRPFIEALPWVCQSVECGAPRPILPAGVRATYWYARSESAMRDAARGQPQPEHSLARSRSWGFGMAPVLDLFNHRHGAPEVGVFPGDTGVIVVANGDIAPGAEVFVSYGALPVTTWMLSYNFFYRSGPQHETCMSMLAFQMRNSTYQRPLDRVACARNSPLSRLVPSDGSASHLPFALRDAFDSGDAALAKGYAQAIIRDIEGS